jgi:hypothetical protein
MKKKLLFISIILNINSVNFSIPELRANKHDFSVAVIIPCYHGHFKFLENLLNEYTKQTKLPDQIVISISEADKIPEIEINKLNNYYWPFELKIITSYEQLFAGPNRNKAIINADTDIIVCQDADDIPHPQRIEIIKYAFDNFEIDYLLHLSSRNQECLNNRYHLENKPINNQEIFNLESIDTKLDGSHGTLSAKKDILMLYNWSKKNFRQDVKLTQKLKKKLGYPRIIKYPLYFYDKKNSSAEYKLAIIKNKPKQ